MKVIFLDVTGTMNDSQTIVAHGMNHPKDSCVQVLKEIIEETGAVIVLTSTFRKHLEYRGYFQQCIAKAGLELISMTGWSEEQTTRNVEIDRWLEDVDGQYEIESFVIIDDDENAGVSFPDRYIRTHISAGLTEGHKADVLQVLNTPLQCLKNDTGTEGIDGV